MSTMWWHFCLIWLETTTTPGKGILVKVYNLQNIGFLKWILNKVLSRIIYNLPFWGQHHIQCVCVCVCVCIYIYIYIHTHTHTHSLYVCICHIRYRIRPLVKNALNAKVIKDCESVLPTYLKMSGYTQQAHSTRPIFTSTFPWQKACQTTEDSDLAVTVVTSQLPPALTLSNECSREQSEGARKHERRASESSTLPLTSYYKRTNCSEISFDSVPRLLSLVLKCADGAAEQAHWYALYS